ncbi:MAG: hypothetical protein WC423_01095, partial [Vulcanimicrobiota bacterium]
GPVVVGLVKNLWLAWTDGVLLPENQTPLPPAPEVVKKEDEESPLVVEAEEVVEEETSSF